MCGIAGFFDKNIDAHKAIKAMTDRMTYRGPDAEGFWTEENSGLTLGHRRLSILDLSENGAQPMHSASGRFVIAYNGEIYNAPQIREKLQAVNPGLHFRGTSDTEVILEAFEILGISQTLSLMKGMFAVALYDRQEKTFYLTRDRAGEKPVYYGFVNGHFVFGSEIAVLKEYPGFREHAEIDRTALQEFMRYGFVPAPLSIYEGIYKLLPGTLLTMKAPFQQFEITTYWSMAQAAEQGVKHPFTGSFEEACEELERLLTESIRSQMISDVPIGAFLSGGIDSPLIVSLMQKISDTPVKTFTIGFEDKKYNEAQFAKEIAAHLGTDHTEQYVSEQDLVEVIPKLAQIYSEPFADSSQIPTYLVSRLARSKVTVSLSGDAGDELFCGYNTYDKISKLFHKVNQIPFGLRKMAGGMCGVLPYGKTDKGYRIARSLREKDIYALHEAVCYHTSYLGEHVVEGAGEWKENQDVQGLYREMSPAGMDERSIMLLKDMQTYHPDDILVKVDRAGMAVSLENRVPMLDRDVMEFAWSLPIEYKDENGVSKRILKEILYRYVPKEMLDRPKKGFSVPLVRWLQEGSTGEWAQTMIRDSQLVKEHYLKREVVDALWKNFKAGKTDAQMIWEILMAEQWYRSGK